MALAFTAREAQLLKASARTWSFRFERVNNVDRTVIGAESVVSCKVACNPAADIARTCTVQLPPTSTFDQLAHSLRPYARLLDPVDGTWHEWCLGTFMLTTPSVDVDDPSVPIEATGYDWSVRGTTTGTDRRWTAYVNPTTLYLYGDLISQMLGYFDKGILDSALGAAGALQVTLPISLDYPPGTSPLKIANELLLGRGYEPIRYDVFGYPQLVGQVDLTKAGPVWTYTRDAAGVVLDNTTNRTLDVFDTPNQWIGIYSQPDVAPLSVTLTNAEGSSRYSTVSRGRTITRVLTDEEVGQPFDLAALTAAVQRIKDADSLAYEEITFSTGLMPFHGVGDVLAVDAGQGVNRYQETSWEAELTIGAQMKHTARRVVTL